MTARHRYGFFIFFENTAEQKASFNHGYSLLFCGDKLGIVLGESGSIHRKPRTVHVFGGMPVKNGRAEFFQFFRFGRRRSVAAADDIALRQTIFCERAHRHAAYSDKMHRDIISQFKIFHTLYI